MTPVEKEWPEVELARIAGVMSRRPLSRVGSGTSNAAEEIETYLPISSVRERLEAEGAEAMARKEYELHQDEMGYETVWEEETQGHRNIYLDAARERIRLALSAAAFLQEEEG